MAQTINQAREKILTSVHGRRLGIDHTERLAGVKGTRKALTNATSDTTGTTLANHGFHSVATTTNDSWTLQDPEVGCEVTLMTGTTSTGNHTITCDAATIVSSAQSTMGVVVLIGGGACVELVGLTTAQWAITGAHGSTVNGPSVAFTTA